MENIIVGIAEGKIGRSGQALVSYALGSCVGVCLYDRRSKTAGMVHVILPQKSDAVCQMNSYKFADEGTRALIRDLEKLGISKARLVAKIAGGAKMFGTGSVQWEIGNRNVEVVKRTLSQERIPIVAEDTGKNYGRTISFFVDDGRLEVRTVKHKVIVL